MGKNVSIVLTPTTSHSCVGSPRRGGARIELPKTTESGQGTSTETADEAAATLNAAHGHTDLQAAGEGPPLTTDTTSKKAYTLTHLRHCAFLTQAHPMPIILLQHR